MMVLFFLCLSKCSSTVPKIHSCSRGPPIQVPIPAHDICFPSLVGRVLQRFFKFTGLT